MEWRPKYKCRCGETLPTDHDWMDGDTWVCQCGQAVAIQMAPGRRRFNVGELSRERSEALAKCLHCGGSGRINDIRSDSFDQLCPCEYGRRISRDLTTAAMAEQEIVLVKLSQKLKRGKERLVELSQKLERTEKHLADLKRPQ